VGFASKIIFYLRGQTVTKTQASVGHCLDVNASSSLHPYFLSRSSRGPVTSELVRDKTSCTSPWLTRNVLAFPHISASHHRTYVHS
jgi:hypothetical protein